ncbi:unnamed protein product [Cuscuta europaea]|uniref:Xylanase inhibitor N-terminal domain-containing protein n=1 Tax=Cuscuta europaea TaxID=41803 RepID=A0A9P1EC28_CUSEU|nr:unnamed protein product [Cuscuta europaea]
MLKYVLVLLGSHLWSPLTQGVTYPGCHAFARTAQTSLKQTWEKCGMIETGANLEGGTINGLLGLGFNTPLDLPGMLASQGLVPNSFSLCFGLDGKGRLAFGDKGSSAHMRAPLDPDGEGYNIQIEKISVDDIAL